MRLLRARSATFVSKSEFVEAGPSSVVKKNLYMVTVPEFEFILTNIFMAVPENSSLFGSLGKRTVAQSRYILWFA